MSLPWLAQTGVAVIAVLVADVLRHSSALALSGVKAAGILAESYTGERVDSEFPAANLSKVR